MSKIYYIVISFCFLVSCASVSNKELKTLIYQSFASSEIKVTGDIFNSYQFSFAKFTIGKESIIVVLVNINNGLYEWISSEGIKLYTYNGKIVKTIGLKHDISISNFNSFDWSKNKTIFITNFYDPDLQMAEIPSYLIRGQDTYITLLDEVINVASYEEKIAYKRIRFNKKNLYLLDERDVVRKTVQWIHPFLPKIEIEYYFK